MSVFCWLIYGARETILKLWTVGLQNKYVLYRSTCKETANEAGGPAHLINYLYCMQERPRVRVEPTTRWSRVTVITLPRTVKTANMLGPLQFAVLAPKVLILNAIRHGSAVPKYCSGLSPPQHRAAKFYQVGLYRSYVWMMSPEQRLWQIHVTQSLSPFLQTVTTVREYRLFYMHCDTCFQWHWNTWLRLHIYIYLFIYAFHPVVYNKSYKSINQIAVHHNYLLNIFMRMAHWQEPKHVASITVINLFN
jgi:hypothetical protein